MIALNFPESLTECHSDLEKSGRDKVALLTIMSTYHKMTLRAAKRAKRR